VLKGIIDASRDYFQAITHWQLNFNIISLAFVLEIHSNLIALYILSFRTTMKVSSLVSFSAIVASALAFPTYGSVNARQTWQPRNWTAPGPTDG
jgi:hypothetical protein